MRRNAISGVGRMGVEVGGMGVNVTVGGIGVLVGGTSVAVAVAVVVAVAVAVAVAVGASNCPPVQASVDNRRASRLKKEMTFAGWFL